MKKKYLIVIADYYKDISKGLTESAIEVLPKSSSTKIIRIKNFTKKEMINL